MNICQQCGACCAFFRVSFYWAEALELQLPDSLIEQVSPHLAAMAGTHRPAPRCQALHGTIGQCVSCLVYSRRPSPCREVQPADEKCNKARARHGLSPLLEAPAPGEAERRAVAFRAEDDADLLRRRVEDIQQLSAGYAEAPLSVAAPGAGQAMLEPPQEAAISLPGCTPDVAVAASGCATDASASVSGRQAEPPNSLPGTAPLL